MHTYIKRSLGSVALAGGLLLAGAAMASADDTGTTSSNATGSSFGSPIEIGGIHAGVSTQSSSSSSSTETRTDRDGTSTSETRTSKDASKSDLGLSTAPTKIIPSAVLTQVTKSATSDRDGGRDNASTGSSTSAGKASSPITVGGITTKATNQRSSESATKSTRTDDDGTRTTEQSTKTDSTSAAALGTGDITANPSAALTQATKSASSSEDRGSDRSTGTTSSSTTGDLGAPVSIGGVNGAFTDERSTENSRKESVTDEDGSRSESEKTSSASATDGGFALGAITADPAASLRDARTSGQRSDDEVSSSTGASDSSLGLTAPVRGDGLAAAFSREDAQARDIESVISDEDGTSRHTESTQSASREALGGQSGAFGFAPALGLDDSRSTTSVLGDDDARTSRDGDTVLTSASPFFYDGFGLGGDFASADARQSTDQVIDEDGSLTRTEKSESAQRTTPGYSFDGFSGDPSGGFSLQNLMEQVRSDR